MVAPSAQPGNGETRLGPVGEPLPGDADAPRLGLHRKPPVAGVECVSDTHPARSKYDVKAIVRPYGSGVGERQDTLSNGRLTARAPLLDAVSSRARHDRYFYGLAGYFGCPFRLQQKGTRRLQ